PPLAGAVSDLLGYLGRLRRSRLDHRANALPPAHYAVCDPVLSERAGCAVGQSMKKIRHLITSLEGGGTENFLYQILAHSPTGYDHEVLYLKKDGVIGDRIRRHQIT